MILIFYTLVSGFLNHGHGRHIYTTEQGKHYALWVLLLHKVSCSAFISSTWQRMRKLQSSPKKTNGRRVRLKTIGRCNILTLKAQSGSQAWCLTPVIPASWRWGLKDLGFKVIHPSLCRKFGDSLGYNMRSCLKTPKQNRRKKTVILATPLLYNIPDPSFSKPALQ